MFSPHLLNPCARLKIPLPDIEWSTAGIMAVICKQYAAYMYDRHNMRCRIVPANSSRMRMDLPVVVPVCMMAGCTLLPLVCR